jgi:hypothetical protein
MPVAARELAAGGCRVVGTVPVKPHERRIKASMLCTPAAKGGPFCGDNQIGAGEDCEGANLGGATCQSLGFEGGTLACGPGCLFDTTDCGCVPPTCGNGVVDGAEQCDGSDLGGASCASRGYNAGGALSCTAGCAYDTSACMCAPASTCGNGVRDGNEQCDGSDLGGATCASLGYTLDGTLACTAGCGYDTSGCDSQAFQATGQTTCWNSSGAVIPCAGTGQDGEVQAGATLSYMDNGDGSVTDVNTGLMWEKKSDDGSIHDKDTSYTWDNAFAVHVAGLNTANFAGYSDWGAEPARAAEHRALPENQPGRLAGLQHGLYGGLHGADL